MIAFVSDIAVASPRRDGYRDALRAFSDPVLALCPNSVWSERPVEGAINVRFFTITLGGRLDVFVGHGLADKAYSHYHTVNGFNYIFTSGPLWRDRYIEMGAPPDKPLMAGFPKLDPIFNGAIKRRPEGKRVLWAPTHPTSWPRQYQALKEAMAGMPFEFVMAEHPMVSKTPTLQLLADADVVINDGGSILYEAWALGKPVVFPTWIVKTSRLVRPNTYEQHIYNERIGYHSDSRGHFIENVRLALEHGIGKREAEFVEGILPAALRGHSAEAYVEHLTEIERRDGAVS